MTTTTKPLESTAQVGIRSRGYLIYLVIQMGLIAVMDQYISTIRTTAIPYIIEQYGVTASQFSWLEGWYLIPTFFIFLLNGLNDMIGRKLSILILTLLMGLSSLAIALFASTLTLFMAFYAVAMFTTVSNMWSIPVSEESPAQQRAKIVSIVYVIGLIPLQALLPPLLINVLGLDWKWMYGVMFVLMLPVLVLWLFMKETERYERIKEQRRLEVKQEHVFGFGVIDRRDVRYILFSAAIWLCWLVNSILYFWAGYYFMTIQGYSLNQWSLVLLATLIMAMIGGVTGGWIMDRLGRRTALIFGCIGLTLSQALLGFAPGPILPIVAAISGFFVSLAYTWVVVYVPEVFPTERRGACMGWTTTAARVSYVAGPLLAAGLLQLFPTMDWFWVVTGLIMLVPIAIVLLFNPYETRVKELEEIEMQR
ncbi:MAG TPA: MFS transporter [Anaerolineae bacterium]|nr:MFS transporter [Anaerolineae bacterium]